MTPRRLFVLASLLALPLAGCDGRAEAAVSTAYLDAAAEAAPDTVGAPVAERIGRWGHIDLPSGPRVPDISDGDPSPDGRLVSLVDWVTGTLSVWDLEADSIRDLTPADWSIGYPRYSSTFSPDGASIAYVWVVTEGDRSELRVVDARGAEEPRVLLRMPEGEVISPTDWREPGILAVAEGGEDTEFRMMMIDAADGSSRTLLESADPIDRPVLSPDGGTVAFGLKGRVHLLATAGGEAQATGIEGAQLLGWPMKGEGLYFYDTQGDIRVVEVMGQRTTGPSRLVRRDGAGWGIGASEDALFTSSQLDGRRVYTVEVDPEGRAIGEPRPVSPLTRGRPTGLRENRSDFPALSPDGQTLAYVQRERIQVASASGDRIRELPVTGDIRDLEWAPDGESLWYRLGSAGGSVLQSYDLRTGESVDVKEFQGPWGLHPNESVLFERLLASDSREGGIWVYDYENGERTPLVALTEDAKSVKMRVSPDGRLLAYSFYDESRSESQLMVVPVDGGAARHVYTGGMVRGAPIFWSPDASRIFVVKWDVDNGKALTSVPVSEGELAVVHRFDWRFPAYPISLNLAAGRMAFASGFETAELWKLDLSQEGGR